MQLPWMKWFPADWRAETTLRMVGREARSVWVDLLGIMHEADGFLLIGGLKPTLKQLSQILGDPEDKIAAWLDELSAAGVCSKTDDGVFFSRRMVKDRQKSATLSAAGKAGGSPLLKPPLKPPLKPSRARVPEARSQKPETRNQTLDLDPTTDRAEGDSVGSRKSANRGERWPSDAIVSDEWIEDGVSARARNNLPPIDLRLEAVRFANHWAGKTGAGAVKRDWRKTWINWAISPYAGVKANGSGKGQFGSLGAAGSVFRDNYLNARARREGFGG